MANKQDYLKRLQVAIQERHKCNATYRRTVKVREVCENKTVWNGEVEIFWLTGHLEAKRCFAWSQQKEDADGQEQIFAILEVPPVIGPATAVRAALAKHQP